MPEPRGGRHAFIGVTAVLFTASAAVTVAWCLSMAGMGSIDMPGGWTLSMAWMPMCGQTWAGAAAAFVGMWAVMMVAMMLPSLAPALWRLRLALGTRPEASPGLFTALAAGGYFSVWIALGALVFAGGAALAQVVLRVPPLAGAAPVFLGLSVVMAGAYQFTAAKARHVAACRPAALASPAALPADARGAWRHGASLGLHCCQACAGLTATLLVIGVMDLVAMVIVTAAITAERLAPAGERIAWAIGSVSLVAGLYLMVRPIWLH